MRWFLDTEFHEDGRIIDLISIALVSEHGDNYYAVSTDFDAAACSDWVKANVLPKLPPVASGLWKPRQQIANEIRELTLANGKPEFWAYFADYDWVVLCQLYGRMIDLPEGFPMFCRDLKQEMSRLQIGKSELPKLENEHDALADARWVRDAYAWIQENKANQ